MARPDGELAEPGGEPGPHLARESIRAPRGVRSAVMAVASLAVLLIGVPFAYQVVTAPPPASPAAVAAASPSAGVPSPSASPAVTSGPGTASTPSAVDMALENLQIAARFSEGSGTDCSVEPIPMVLGRSRRLDGTVEAHDHGVWVFSCRHETGDRNRYFVLASAVTDELARIGATFLGSTSYVGDPGGLLETRWQVDGTVLSGEIELLAVPAATQVLTLVLQVDLRGTWQGSPPSP